MADPEKLANAMTYMVADPEKLDAAMQGVIDLARILEALRPVEYLPAEAMAEEIPIANCCICEREIFEADEMVAMADEFAHRWCAYGDAA